MKVQKKNTQQHNYLKKGEHIKDGDILEIKNEGEIVPGDFGDSHVFEVKAPTAEGHVSFNQTSINNLIDAYGDDTANWVGKQAKAWVNRENVSGQFRNILYLTAPNQDLEGNMVDVNAELQQEADKMK